MAYPSLRALLAMAAANDYMMTGFDVKHAFIQQRLDLSTHVHGSAARRTALGEDR